MRIADVRLSSADLDGARDFYSKVLGLPVSASAGRVQVAIGVSALTLVSGPVGPGVHHLAFDVPRNRFADAKAWLGDRAQLIALDGEDEFTGPGDWNSRSVYFRGPAGVVLELIARQALGNDAEAPFGSTDLLCVSEIGIAVPDVPAAVDRLCQTFDIEPFGPGSETFVPLGDHDGLLIVVARGRVWFPTDGSVSQGGPTAVTLAGVPPGRWSPPGVDCTVTG